VISPHALRSHTPDTHATLLLFGAAAWLHRDLLRVDDLLDEQCRVLLDHCKRQPRLSRSERQRLAILAQRIERKRLETLALVVTPDTLRRWYRTLVAAKWTFLHGPRRGRPPIDPLLAAIVIRIARENSAMGAPGIAARMRNLGHRISTSTERRLLHEHGIDLQPLRDTESDWSTFLNAHAEQIAAIDFTTVETMESDGSLTTHYALIAMHHDTRRVHLVGITTHPHSDWIAQQARNLTDPDNGFLRNRRYLVMDRDGSFSHRFRDTLKAGGVTAIRTPPQSPNCNAFIERFFRSLKSECLRHLIPLGENGLRLAINEWLVHYHTERPHQGLGGAVIDPHPITTTVGPVRCRHRLGGILKHYYREAA
jgi:putative transposase